MKRKKKKKPFKHVTLHEKLVDELKSFKIIVGQELDANRFISIADVIIVSLKYYKDHLKMAYPVDEKLLVGRNLENENLSVVNSITPKPCSAAFKLDEKTSVSFSVES